MLAFAYVRVSSKGQLDGDGFDRQRESIRRYAALHDITVSREFEESATGTRDTLDRPALCELIESAKTSEVKLVLVERADRLARDLIIGEMILKDLSKLGVRVLDASGTDLSVSDGDPTKTLIRQVLSAVAQYEKTALVLKLRAARQRIKRKGLRCEGRKPFGLTESESKIVSRIREMWSRGQSLRSIAVVLNNESIPTRTGRQWKAQTVKNALR